MVNLNELILAATGKNVENVSEFELITQKLYSLIPQEEMKEKEATLGETSPEFLGFVEIYYYLSKTIPKDWTVIDFGASHNAQAYFFTEHKKYMAVNPISGIIYDDGMFCPPNCTIYRMTAGEFIKTIDYPKDHVFAICNFVPNWYDENPSELVRTHFKNCYTFFPERESNDYIIENL